MHRDSCQILSLLHLVILFSINIKWNEAHMLANNPYSRAEQLNGKYNLEWVVDLDSNRILFNLTVDTINRWILFGFQSDSNGVDVVIGGITNGKPYFSDRHSKSIGSLPEVDFRQDYSLHEAYETATQTFLSFSRELNTHDVEDFPITTDKITLIWAYGETDTEILTESGWKHHQHRGSYDVYLLDPNYSPKIIRDPVQGLPTVIGRESSELKVWAISRKVEIPQSKTSYLCTIHKGPRLSQKNHLVGFNTQFNREESRKYVRSMLIYKCNSPRGSNLRSMFEPFLKFGSQSCYLPHKPEGEMPTNYCTELIHEWNTGGRSYFTPNDVGYPFGLSHDEYYMIQAHYDNPTEDQNIFADFDLELYYTHKLRANDAGILVIGHEVPGLTPSLLIPPSSSNHMIFGHCGGECTKLIFPQTGIKIFATSLHSHDSGRKLTLHHFRTRELPWVSFDWNFNPSFQQIRILQDHVKVLPGDHLIMRCVYDTTNRNGTTVGGFSRSQERCLAYVHYYNKINEFTSCTSEIISEDYRRRFLGVSNVTWEGSRQEFIVEDDLETREGLSITEVSDNHVLWEPEMEAELQRFHKYHPQINKCFRELYAREDRVADIDEAFVGSSSFPKSNSKDEYSGATAYPFSAKEYTPEES